MKLQTHIKPRADGTVVFRDGKSAITFTADPVTGALVGDVENPDLIVKLLLTEQFMPANEQDYDAADALLSAVSAPPQSTLHVDLGGDDDDLPDDDPVDMNAGLVEANTPPVTRQVGKAAGAPAGKRAAQRGGQQPT